MTKPCPGPAPASPPKLKAPAGACDTHAHIVGPFDKFPLADERGYTPPISALEDFEVFQKTLGIDRAVIVHPSCYGTMMDVTVDAVTRLGDRARGIAVVEPSITDAELDRLDAIGFRGLRFTTLLKGGADVSGIVAMAERIKRLGWHIQMFIDAENQLESLLPSLKKLPVDLVIDHMGHFQPEAGVDHPAFRAMLDLVKDGHCWVKLSGAYRASGDAPAWQDMTAYATTLIETRPDRMVWATDWPHVMLWDKPMPEGAALLDWALSWNIDETTMKQILVDNPAQLYGFG
jgi:predicted TIM-barrel fold metal-dependent hydrolase